MQSKSSTELFVTSPVPVVGKKKRSGILLADDDNLSTSPPPTRDVRSAAATPTSGITAGTAVGAFKNDNNNSSNNNDGDDDDLDHSTTIADESRSLRKVFSLPAVRVDDERVAASYRERTLPPVPPSSSSQPK